MSNFSSTGNSNGLRKPIILIVTFFVGFGIPWCLLSPHFSEPIEVVDYQKDAPLYADRDYANSAETPVLEDAKVVLIERHRSDPIWIETDSDITVFRMLTPVNDNTDFLSHDEVDADIHVKGLSCTMEKLVKLELEAGTHTLPPGGPVAASPLLIVSDAEFEASSRYSLLTWLTRN